MNLCSENLKLHGFFDVLAFALLTNSSCTNFEQHEFFHSPKNVHLKALLYTFLIMDQKTTQPEALLYMWLQNSYETIMLSPQPTSTQTTTKLWWN